MKHHVEIGGGNRFYGVREEWFEAGEMICFTVPVCTDCITSVTSEDAEIRRVPGGGYDPQYYFIMPDRDVTVSITQKNNMVRYADDDRP